MRSFRRVLLLTASVPLVLLLARPALAATELAMFKCDDPTGAASDLYNYFSDNPLDTSDFALPDDCERLCSELLKLCQQNVKSRIGCVNTDDSFFYKLQKALCDLNFTGDAAKACKNGVKQAQSVNKEENKSLQEDADFECEDDFGEGGNCGFDCADGTLDDD
jgi:hypothetical protein